MLRSNCRRSANRQDMAQLVLQAMRFIRRKPGKRTTGGYAEFTDWYHFLGKARDVRVYEASKRIADRRSC